MHRQNIVQRKKNKKFIYVSDFIFHLRKDYKSVESKSSLHILLPHRMVDDDDGGC